MCLFGTILKQWNSLKYATAQLSSYQRQFKEVSIPVPWGHVSGKWWEPYNIRPILSLHGLQDNCGTFDRLLPMLDKNVGFLAIDLPGHGLSSRLPPGMYYSSSCYLITLNYIRDFLQWDNISFIGHSLGALIAYTYCMMHQDRVDFLICLDGSKPLVTENFIKHMAMLLDKFLEYNKFAFSLEEPPSYTIDEIKEKIAKPNDNSVDLEYAHCLMERSIAPSKLHPGKYYITKDPRLRIGEVMSFSHEQLIQSARYLTSPICIIKATGSSYYEDKNNFYKVIDLVKRTSSDFDFHYVDGTHHVHLNHPERVAGIVNSFIGRHNMTAWLK